MNKKISVLGAGSWGTTLAILLFKKGFNVTLWEIDKIQAQFLDKKRVLNFLPQTTIPKEILITANLEIACQEAKIVVFAVPSQFMENVAKKVANLRKTEKYIAVSAAKGFDRKSLKRMSEVLEKELVANSQPEIAVLSGPSHAEEVSKGIPTAIVIASKNISTAKFLQTVFMTPLFRVYTSEDIIGVEIGGSLKNIIALACGISDGLGLGDNTKAALMTRGLAEIGRLGMKMGANPFTFPGLSGMGDLIVTCMSRHSRNRNLGEKIGQGKSLKTALKEIIMVAEGVPTTKCAYKLAEKLDISLPITKEVYQVLFENKKPQIAIKNLMERKPKGEL